MNSDNTQLDNGFLNLSQASEFETLDDFIKELEEKERDLHISYSGAVIEIEEDDLESSDIAKLEALVKSYESSLRQPSEISPAPNLTHSFSANKLPVVAESESVASVEDKPEETAAKTNLWEAKKLREEVEKLNAERKEMVETFRRRQNDFDNFKRRIEREQEENQQSILTNFASKVLPVIDNLTRALYSSSKLKGEKSQDFIQFIRGIEMVANQLNEALAEMQIYPIPAVGKPFDPHLHEAAATEPNGAYPPNTVIEEILKGYKFKDKVIRHSVVKVSSGEADILADLTKF